jgi:hypothetical protein
LHRRQLHIFAALAQEERRLISERTKAALAEAKRRGRILGSNGRYLAAKNRKAADDFASQLRAKLDADLLQCSYSVIARRLNDDAGITTMTGRKFYPQTVKNYVKRFGKVYCLATFSGFLGLSDLATSYAPVIPNNLSKCV